MHYVRLVYLYSFLKLTTMCHFGQLKRLHYRSRKIGIAIHLLTISCENALFEELFPCFVIFCNSEISAKFFESLMKIIRIAIVQKILVA